jgi:pimeloyl-[acyl-carrier protein] methyl ester esterase
MDKIIFVSGWGSVPSIWNPVISHFMPNYGCNSLPWWDCLRRDKLNDNLLFKLLAEQEKPTILVGWSLGGMVTLSAAANFPKKVDGIVLISSSARMVQDKRYTGVSNRVLKAMKLRLKTDKQGLLNDFVVMGTSSHDLDRFAYMREFFVDKALEIDNDKLFKGLSYLQNYDLRDKLKDIRIPVNIIHGECDKIIDLENARYLCDNLSNTNLNIIRGSGHFLIHSNPEIIIDSVKDLLKKV